MRLTKSPIQKEELSQLMQHEAEKEGWLYSAEDVSFYLNYFGEEITALKVDGNLAGCFIMHRSIGRIQGKPICSAGFLLVFKKYRGQKIMGPFLWENFIPTANNEDRFICFHSVPRAVNLYQRLGFSKTGLVNIFYTLNIQNVNRKLVNTAIPLLDQKTLKIIDKDNKNDITKFNKTLFGTESGAGFCDFIQQWQARPDAKAIAYYDKGIIKGYGIATLCKKLDKDGKSAMSYRLSPIYANSDEVAESILKALVHHALENNAQMIQLSSLADLSTPFGQSLTSVGFTAQGKNYVVSNYAGMISKEAPILGKIFASLPLEYAHEVTGGFID
jgi:hypothetical protein